MTTTVGHLLVHDSNMEKLQPTKRFRLGMDHARQGDLDVPRLVDRLICEWWLITITSDHQQQH